MKCKYCVEKEKTWKESDSPIECAFETGVFSENNWNCGTMDLLRDKAEKNEVYNDDMYAGLVPYCFGETQDNSYESGYLYIEWYKSRGTTDKCIDMECLLPITLDKALKIIN